jgi:hypothetical protein
MKRALWGIFILIAGFCVLKAINRDAHLIKMFTQDLRNRVVGARLQKDGIAPYFYKWKREDGLRYYDPNNFDSLKVSVSTASPFFHQLMYPFADLPQYKIKTGWLIAQYILLLAMVILCLCLTQSVINRLMIVCIAVAFLFTEAWKNLVVAGQLYIVIPFLFLLFFFFFRKVHKPVYTFICGIIFITLVLIRPNAIVAFVPLLFIANRFTIKTIIIFLMPAVVFLSAIIGSAFNRKLWYFYRDSIHLRMQYHDNNSFNLFQTNEPHPHFAIWEGVNTADMANEQKRFSFKSYSEHANVFVLVEHIFGVTLTSQTLLNSSLIIILLLCVLFYFYFRKQKFLLLNLIILGYCFYMISDLFSPIYRYQYYTTQWIVLLFLSAAYFSKAHIKVYLFILLGLFFNLINTSLIPMRHTIGEYIWLTSFVVLSFMLTKNDVLNKQLKMI